MNLGLKVLDIYLFVIFAHTFTVRFLKKVQSGSVKAVIMFYDR